MSICPQCETEFEKDFGLVHCPGCGVLGFVQMDDSFEIQSSADRSTRQSEDKLDHLESLDEESEAHNEFAKNSEAILESDESIELSVYEPDLPILIQENDVKMNDVLSTSVLSEPDFIDVDEAGVSGEFKTAIIEQEVEVLDLDLVSDEGEPEGTPQALFESSNVKPIQLIIETKSLTRVTKGLLVDILSQPQLNLEESGFEESLSLKNPLRLSSLNNSQRMFLVPQLELAGIDYTLVSTS